MGSCVAVSGTSGGALPAYVVTAMSTWWDQAACRGAWSLGWFPPRGERTDDVMRICAACAVTAECVGHALGVVDGRREPLGVWGGSSERQRRVMRAAMRRGVDPSVLIAEHVDRLRQLSAVA